MANENKDVIRVETTEALLPTTVRAGQLGFASDTKKMLYLESDGVTEQWYQSDTSTWLIWDANGNGGITTSSPQAKLDIYTDDDVKLALSDPDDSDGHNNLVRWICNSTIKYNMGFYNATTPNPDYFAINPDGATGICMNSTGQVGIQLTNPAYALDINGEAHCNGNVYLSSLTPGSVLFLGAGSSAYQAIYEDNGNLFWDESWARLGIGTNTPNEQLEVTGNIRNSALTASKIVATDANKNLVSITASSAYSISNVTTDRTYDANSTTLDEIADVLGTLIADLQARYLLG